MRAARIACGFPIFTAFAAEEFDEGDDIPYPAAEEKKPEPKKTYSEDEYGYGERREKSGYRDMIIN